MLAEFIDLDPGEGELGEPHVQIPRGDPASYALPALHAHAFIPKVVHLSSR